MKLPLLALCLLLLSGLANAEQKKTLGKWDVHYIAVESTFFTPEIAKAYGITRSKNSVLVNISVLNREDKQAQKVKMTGTARNLLGSTTELEFREIIEGQAIYYIAELHFDDQEHYRFDIQLQQQAITQRLRFEQKLYKE